MELTGILIKKVGEREGVSQRNGNPWKIAEYLVEVPGQYPRHTVFSVSDGQVGRIARFDSLIGKNVTVSFDLDAHEYNGRWFNDITAWGIMEYVASTTRQANINAAQQQAGEQQADAPFPPADTPFPPHVDANGKPTTEGGTDDLPF